MHSCKLDDLLLICPNCKTEHKQEFDSEFYKNKHYLISYCPNCDYKIFIPQKELSSGKKVEKILNKNII